MKLAADAIAAAYNLLWGDLFAIPLPGGGSLEVSLLVLLLIPTGIFFTVRTRLLPIRLLPEMLRVTGKGGPAGRAAPSLASRPLWCPPPPGWAWAI